MATSIPHVRSQIARIHHRPSQARAALAGDLAAIGLVALAVLLDRDLWAGGLAVLIVIAIQRAAATRPVPRPVILGLRQMAMGFGVVVAAAAGVALSAT